MLLQVLVGKYCQLIFVSFRKGSKKHHLKIQSSGQKQSIDVMFQWHELLVANFTAYPLQFWKTSGKTSHVFPPHPCNLQPLKFNSSPLKTGDWKTIRLHFGAFLAYFQGQKVSFRECTCSFQSTPPKIRSVFLPKKLLWELSTFKKQSHRVGCFFVGVVISRSSFRKIRGSLFPSTVRASHNPKKN